MKQVRRFFAIAAGVLVGIFAWSPLGLAQPSGITFGVVPQESAVKLAGTWIPLIEHLSRGVGAPLKLTLAPSIAEFENRVEQGAYDIAYMNPYQYIVAHRKAGYRACAKEKGVQLKGLIVVRKDSPVQRVEDLKGKHVVFPDPKAFAATLLTKALLKERGIDPDRDIRVQYVDSHDSVYLAVQNRLADAGSGVPRTFQKVGAIVIRDLRILVETPTTPPHAIACHPRLDPQIAARLVQLMGDLETTEAGRAVLWKLGFTGIVPAEDAEWDAVRKVATTLKLSY